MDSQWAQISRTTLDKSIKTPTYQRIAITPMGSQLAHSPNQPACGKQAYSTLIPNTLSLA